MDGIESQQKIMQFNDVKRKIQKLSSDIKFPVAFLGQQGRKTQSKKIIFFCMAY